MWWHTRWYGGGSELTIDCGEGGGGTRGLEKGDPSFFYADHGLIASMRPEWPQWLFEIFTVLSY